MTDRVSSKQLLAAGLQIMRNAGRELKKIKTSGRAQIYEMNNGETIRVRTCNDHVLLIAAENDGTYENMSIKGTDWILVVMPEIERTQSNIMAYLIPTDIAVEEARKILSEWTAIGSKTRGEHVTWYLFFSGDKGKRAYGYHEKWKQYLMESNKAILPKEPRPQTEEAINPLKQEIDIARHRIAKAAGVPAESVRISIDFGA